MSSRRDFIKTTGSLTIGFCLTGFVSKTATTAPTTETAANAGPGDLPGDLNDYPRIDSWLQVLDNGHIRILTGKLELGQGIRTAVAQVAAEELDLDMSQVEVQLADTDKTPDEGYTSGSNSIEASATAIRYAAAAARQRLLEEAAKKLNAPISELTLKQGIIRSRTNRSISIAALLDGRQLTGEVHMPIKLKPKDQHHLIGKPIPRADNEAIVYGHPYYIQDHQPGSLLHGAAVRPPGYGAKLKSFDEETVKKAIPGLIKIVANGSFLGVLTTTQYDAFKAQKLLKENAHWEDGPALPKLEPGQLPAYLRTLPVKSETVKAKGSLQPTTRPIKASYSKPYIMHGALGPSCAIALYDDTKNQLHVHTHSQGVYPLRQTLAAMLKLRVENIHVSGVPGSGCYGHNGADDVAADAALLAMASPGKPIQVQWTRDDEHAWEPYGSAMLMDLEAALDETGKITQWKYDLYSDTHGARPSGHPENLLAARYLEKPFSARPSGFSGGANRNSEPYYDIPNQLIQANFFQGPLRTSSLRSLGAFANIFAIESFMDELAVAAGKDPFEFRLQHLTDDRARQTLQKLQEIIKAQTPEKNAGQAIGISFSRYKNNGTYCAVAARIATTSHLPKVEKLWAVVDAGEVINLDGLKNQIEGGMIQATSWTLLEQVTFDEKHITSRQWATYPVLHIDQAPHVEVVVIDRPEEPPMGAGEAAQGPTAAAITNAVFHATGQRIRNLPIAAGFQKPAKT